MRYKPVTRYEQFASYLFALGHPMRIEIVLELLKGPKNAGDVGRSVNLSQANTSQHLSKLRISGIVQSARKGNIKVYSLKEPGKIQRIMNALEESNQEER
ncbi:MAG TPA: metalloregulator ArsR/SmtB family transcription factor [Deltaproteobacteria bacterium]|jgi:ArsR family transcriptional regulator|nr:metalloregulator ArsR/SmtB family transcription factor [Deltaproteobacteria bacterium]